jgi:hypothetical protein
MRKHIGVGAAVAAALASFGLLSAASAQGNPAPAPKKPKSITGKLTLVAAPTGPVTIALAQTNDHARVGSLTLLVMNDSPVKGRLRIRYFVAKTGVYSDLVIGQPDQPPSDRPAIYDQTPQLTIGAHQTRLVQLRFAVASAAPPDFVDGLLMVTLKPARAAKVQPITLQTRGQFETGASSASEAPQPPSVAMVVTSALPFGHWWLWGEHQRVLIPAKRDEAVDRKQVVVIGSQSGGLLRAILNVKAKDEASSNGLTPANIVVDHVGRSDKYSGDLALGPNSADKLMLTVHVRDFFLWPLLALAAGAFLGGFGTMWWEQRRRRALLVKRAKDAYGVYEAFTHNRPPDRPPPRLDPDPQAQLGTLIEAIDSANSDEDYNTQVDAVVAYEDNLRLWLRLAKAADLLLEHQVSSEAEWLATDVEAMIAWLAVKPDDPQTGNQLAAQAERLAEIVDAFIAVWQLWEARGRPTDLNPASCYVHNAFMQKTTALEVRRDLEERRIEILAWQPAEAAPADQQNLLLSLAGADSVPVALAGRRVFWKGFDQLPSAAIEHRVRMFDWAVASASALVTLLAFLLAKYGQDYGSLSDYAEAFTAGFVGQLAGATIAWNLFPPFRSYRASKAEAAALPTTT